MTNKRDSSSPFAQLAKLRAQLPSGPAREPEPIDSGPARAVVRLERKHRGGKEVTVIEKLGLGADDLARWCRELKRSLGCGGSIEDGAIVLQGDLRARVPELLAARGVGRITVS